MEHISPWTDLESFEPLKAPEVDFKFTDDISFMDQLCGDILEQVDLSPSSQSSLLLVAIGVHTKYT